MLTVLDEEDEDPRVPLSLVVLEGGGDGEKPVVLGEKVDVLRRSEMGGGVNGNGHVHMQSVAEKGGKRKRSASPAAEELVMEGKKGKMDGNGTGKGKAKASDTVADGVVQVDDVHSGAILIDD